MRHSSTLKFISGSMTDRLLGKGLTTPQTSSVAASLEYLTLEDKRISRLKGIYLQIVIFEIKILEPLQNMVDDP